MGVYDDLSKLDSDSPTPKLGAAQKSRTKESKARKETNAPVDQSTDQSTNQLTNRPIDRQIDQLTNWLAYSDLDVSKLGPVVERPRAFYITQKVDNWLDEAVRYLRQKGMHKVDRSVLINALLHNQDLFKPRFLNKISKILLAHMTNKSLKRAQSTD